MLRPAFELEVWIMPLQHAVLLIGVTICISKNVECREKYFVIAPIRLISHLC
uniref:Uncharacterized protein n=1 Tax=Physcomitrium patens TaxID=3218 RepID=A0A2K1L775_PHYPA|nr:hypothetical protein PHYPA_000297 [Physcomitrium patens]